VLNWSIGEDQLLPKSRGRTLYAQPFWRFSGYYSENSYFDIIVQACRMNISANTAHNSGWALKPEI
jgi:hypothetical protein